MHSDEGWCVCKSLLLILKSVLLEAMGKWKQVFKSTLGIVVSVLTSLAGVWLLSQLIGFEFKPVLVGALSASMAAVVMIDERRRHSKKNGFIMR